MKNTLHFRLGKDLGKLLSEISREHIMINNDPEAAYKTFSQSGAPPMYALDLLSGKKVIVVDENREDCWIEEYNPEKHKQYPEPINWREWAENKVNENLDTGNYFMGIIKGVFYKTDINTNVTLLITEEEFKNLFNVPDYIESGYDWKGYCKLRFTDILKLWDKVDELIHMKSIGDAEILQCFKSLDSFLESTSKLIPCVSWLYDQYGGDKNKLSALQKILYDGSTLLSLLSEYEENKDRINIILSPYIIEDSKEEDGVEKYIKNQTALENELKYLSSVDITKGWDAGYISPSGKVYALCGESGQFLHMQLADRIYELYGWAKPKENIDWELDRRGWIKFHSGECLFSGYNIMPEIPITNAQKYELARYAKSRGSIKCGYDRKIVTEDDLTGQTEEYYKELFVG